MKPYNSKRKIKYFYYPHLYTSKKIKYETNKLKIYLELKYKNNRFISINYMNRLSLLNFFIKSISFWVKKISLICSLFLILSFFSESNIHNIINNFIHLSIITLRIKGKGK